MATNDTCLEALQPADQIAFSGCLVINGSLRYLWLCSK